jgi:hypothetical protein
MNTLTKQSKNISAANKAMRCSLRPARGRCYDFLDIFAEKIGEKMGGFCLKTKLNCSKI